MKIYIDTTWLYIDAENEAERIDLVALLKELDGKKLSVSTVHDKEGIAGARFPLIKAK